jgi:hypothetical protein
MKELTQEQIDKYVSKIEMYLHNENCRFMVKKILKHFHFELDSLLYTIIMKVTKLRVSEKITQLKCVIENNDIIMDGIFNIIK